MPEYVCAQEWVNTCGVTKEKDLSMRTPKSKAFKFLHSVKLRKFSFLKINVRRKSQMFSEKQLSMKLLEFRPSLIKNFTENLTTDILGAGSLFPFMTKE